MSTVDTQVLPSGTRQVDKVHSTVGFAVDLQSPDFFGAQAHPELTFTSKAIKREGDRVHRARRSQPAKQKSGGRSRE